MVEKQTKHVYTRFPHVAYLHNMPIKLSNLHSMQKYTLQLWRTGNSNPMIGQKLHARTSPPTVFSPYSKFCKNNTDKHFHDSPVISGAVCQWVEMGVQTLNQLIYKNYIFSVSSTAEKGIQNLASTL